MAKPRIVFLLEYSLGHVTHAQNLKDAVARADSIEPIYVELPYDGIAAKWARLPVVRSNWSVRASLAARIALRNLPFRPEALFFHTQVTSLFSTDWMRKIPSVVSLDATPLQYDSMGALYGHASDEPKPVAKLKRTINCRAFAAARQLVTWSEWAKEGLSQYNVPADKVTVIPPGIDTQRWDFSAERNSLPNKMYGGKNLLFVGGDFERKGGKVLLEAFAALPQSLDAHLHIVTKSENAGDGLPNVTVYRGLTANSTELRRLFAQADLFVFPTQGDCLPLAILEALAAGLPIITTNIGALPEAVSDGASGKIVPVGNASSLADAVRDLMGNDTKRREMAVHARQTACDRFDAAKNYGALVSLLTDVAKEKR